MRLKEQHHPGVAAALHPRGADPGDRLHHAHPRDRPQVMMRCPPVLPIQTRGTYSVMCTYSLLAYVLPFSEGNQRSCLRLGTGFCIC
ncbi:hypothetical protein GDO81_030228 [Engystomops pustulosus]|uniref:Uncharacterized protein n=1 Tax=Engystomops pustulosus TaxID=76066 RepID=A0AAV6YB43_ENGPU|nr:hypothetical protein GDO81_030228 [Engystomops pustulosus]